MAMGFYSRQREFPAIVCTEIYTCLIANFIALKQ